MINRDINGVIREKARGDQSVRKLCHLENQEYEKIRRMGHRAERFHKIYHLDKKTGMIFYPKGIMEKVGWINVNEQEYNIDYQLDLPFNAELRPNQQDIVDKCKENNLIHAHTGFGKTYVAAGLINKYKVRTLIVCPKKEIARHLVDEFKKTFGEDNVGLFNSKDPEYLPPVMVIVGNSFNIHYKHLSSYYDMLIIDEAHMAVTSTKRLEAYFKFGCKYFFGMTGTPKRDEIGPEVFNLIFGDRIVGEGSMLMPEVKTYEYEKKIEMFMDYQEAVTIAIADDERTEKMVDIVEETMKGREMGIIFCDRVEMVTKLAEGLNERGSFARAYTGETKDEDRLDILDDVHRNNGVMVCTYQTAGVGFDYPPLDTGFFFMQIKFSSPVRQAIGRILRPYPKKLKPLIVDFHDSKVPIFRNQFNQRKRCYKQYFGTYCLSNY